MYSIKELIEKVNKVKTIAIIGHKDPDADALASVIAIKKLIQNNSEDEKYIDLFADCEQIDEIYEPIIKDEYFCSFAVMTL